MTLKELCKQAHQIAVEKGFWHCEQCEGFEPDEVCGLCEGTGQVKRNVSELLMLIVSELGEACEALSSAKQAISYPCA